MRTINLTEKQLSKLVNRLMNEQETERYMFFSNLEQIKRQCEELLSLDPKMVEDILNNGHDWADDHITVSKENMSQVYDFMINETKNSGDMLSDDEVMMEGRKKTGTKLCKRGYNAAKAKFKVHPSAYSNGYGVQVCQGKQPGTDGKKRCSPPYC